MTEGTRLHNQDDKHWLELRERYQAVQVELLKAQATIELLEKQIELLKKNRT